MGISSSALASLVIAGTAIGGSTIAVMANSSQPDLKSTNISQISEAPQTPILPGSLEAAPAPVPTTMVPNRIAMPTNPTPDPTLPVVTPPPFNLGGDDDEDDDEYEDSEDGEYDDEGDHEDEDDHDDDYDEEGEDD